MAGVGEGLPERFPIFPLRGALLLPEGRMPLVIFEPRYVAMVRDAMRTDRVIGMVQPLPGCEAAERPPIYEVGCLGRISSFTEKAPDRYHITLTGLCRFDIEEELATTTPYRQAWASFARWRRDLMTEEPPPELRARLLPVLRSYLETLDIQARWSALEQAPLRSLVVTLAMILPFAAEEKQAFLEAPGLAEQSELLITLLQMALAGEPGEGPLH